MNANKKYCECGCGKEISTDKKYVSKYIHGHYAKHHPQVPKPSCWDTIESSIVYLKSISIDGLVPGYAEIRRKYGKPFRRNIKKHGGYKSVVQKAGLKIKNGFLASDGHNLSSYYEWLFDEYLFLNGIQHEIDGFICDESLCRYDFKIGDVYVEIWGVSAVASELYNNYLQRRKKKEKIYASCELKLISIEGKDFGKSSDQLQSLFKYKLAEYNIQSRDEQQKYPIFNRRKLDYWNDKTVVEELKSYVDVNGYFPTFKQLLSQHRADLGYGIQLCGGYRKFARLLGFEPQTKAYSEENTINELKSIMKSLGHFPNDRELQEMKRAGLAGNIKAHGGYGYFKERIIGKRDKRPWGYWLNEDNIITELKTLTEKLGHFPRYAELGQIAKGINKSGKGMKYFKKKVV